MKKYNNIVKWFEEKGFKVAVDCFEDNSIETAWINATTEDLDLLVIVDEDEYLFRVYYASDFDDVVTRKTQSGIMFQIEKFLNNQELI